MKRWLLENWQKIFIGLFALLWLTKCSESCNVKTENSILKEKIEVSEHVILDKNILIKELTDSISHMNELLKIERNFSGNYSNIASGNQNRLIKKNDELYIKNLKLEKEIDNLKTINDSLKNKIIKMEETDYENKN